MCSRTVRIGQERLVEATKSKEQGNARFKAPRDCCGVGILLENRWRARLEASKMPFVHTLMPSIFWATRPRKDGRAGESSQHCRLPLDQLPWLDARRMQPSNIILSDLRQIAIKGLKMDFGQIHFVTASVLFGLCIPEPTELRCRGEKRVSHGPSSFGAV